MCICAEKSNIMHILHSKIIGVCKKGGKGKEGKGTWEQEREGWISGEGKGCRRGGGRVGDWNKRSIEREMGKQ